jgi:regulator of CtrA degradation
MGDTGQRASGGKPPPAWQAEAISGFARSELFDRTFKEGMDLVEETAAYLDGAGRQDSKLLSRSAALAYAAESMRLTTRLMQVASWLLVQRAVREGDMAPEAAQDASYRLAAESQDGERTPFIEPLPTSLGELLARSERLFERVRHLDARMYQAAAAEPPHPVLAQLERLKDAFEA